MTWGLSQGVTMTRNVQLELIKNNNTDLNYSNFDQKIPHAKWRTVQYFI